MYIIYVLDGVIGVDRWPDGGIHYLHYFMNEIAEKCTPSASRRESGVVEHLREKAGISALDKKWHRTDGAAFTEWYRSGKCKRELFCIHGLPHRANAPAYLKWRESGQLAAADYYLYGEKSIECAQITVLPAP